MIVPGSLPAVIETLVKSTVDGLQTEDGFVTIKLGAELTTTITGCIETQPLASS